MRKAILIISLLLIAVSGNATIAHIDSLRVDGDHNQLILRGEFGEDVGNVYIQGILMRVYSWSDTLVISAIKPLGNGSAGDVVVRTNSGWSDTAMITRIRVGIRLFQDFTVPGYDQNLNTSLETYIRLDPHDLLSESQQYEISPSPESSLLVTVNSLNLHKASDVFDYSSSGSTALVYDTIPHNFGLDVQFDPRSHTFEVWLYSCPTFLTHGTGTSMRTGNDTTLSEEYSAYAFLLPVALNSDFSIDSLYRQWQDQGHAETRDTIIGGSVEYLPRAIAALGGAVHLAMPENHGLLRVDTLVWHSEPLVTSYLVEISRDSTFATLLDSLETADTTLSISLTDPGKYFWRVRAKNSEGVSHWSNQWSFEIELNRVEHSVGPQTVSVRQTNLSLIIQGAAMDVLTISNNLGEQIQERTLHGGYQVINFNSLNLPHGFYYATILSNGDITYRSKFEVP